MNPTPQTPEEEKTIQIGSTPSIDPATFVPEQSSAEADEIALEAIGVLEAEEGTSRVIHPQEEEPILADIPQPVEPSTSFDQIATPLVSPEPEPTLSNTDSTAPASVVAPFGVANTLQEEPFQTNSNPFPKQKKSLKKLIIILIAAIVLIGGAVAGYFVWQSMQSDAIVETSESATGDQPGGTVTTNTTDTEASVNDAADALETDADAIDDTVYDDNSLSDTTLYQN